MKAREGIVVLSGGVGGARFAAGVQAAVGPEALTVVVNTADDFRYRGLHIAPDLDTVLYTLAGLENPATGWGRADETDRVHQELVAIGADPWFFLGDRDLALHLTRTEAMAAGATLTDVTRDLALRFGLRAAILPMCDDAVRTVVTTADGDLAFQDWFVRRRCEPPALGLRFVGVDTARPAPCVLETLESARLILVGPSNPYLSVGPILAVPDVLEAVIASAAPVVAVSPVIGGRAVKGPAAQMLIDFAGQATPIAVADCYGTFLDGLAIDTADAGSAAAVEARGVAVLVTDILMRGAADRRRLASEVLAFAAGLSPSRRT